MNDFIILLANVALTLSVVVAVVFGIAQVKTAARDRRERLTLEMLSRFQTHDFAQLIYFITSYKAPTSYAEYRTLPAEDQVRFIQLAQEMESLGILVADGYVDLDLVDKTLGSFVSSTWEKHKPLCEEMREKLPDPFLNEYYQWLAERIDERMQNNPRAPFHLKPTGLAARGGK